MIEDMPLDPSTAPLGGLAVVKYEQPCMGHHVWMYVRWTGPGCLWHSAARRSAELDTCCLFRRITKHSEIDSSLDRFLPQRPGPSCPNPQGSHRTTGRPGHGRPPIPRAFTTPGPLRVADEPHPTSPQLGMGRVSAMGTTAHFETCSRGGWNFVECG